MPAVTPVNISELLQLGDDGKDLGLEDVPLLDHDQVVAAAARDRIVDDQQSTKPSAPPLDKDAQIKTLKEMRSSKAGLASFFRAIKITGIVLFSLGLIGAAAFYSLPVLVPTLIVITAIVLFFITVPVIAAQSSAPASGASAGPSLGTIFSDISNAVYAPKVAAIAGSVFAGVTIVGGALWLGGDLAEKHYKKEIEGIDEELAGLGVEAPKEQPQVRDNRDLPRIDLLGAVGGFLHRQSHPIIQVGPFFIPT